MLDTQQLLELREFARQIRIHTLQQIAHRGFGHVGGSMSIVELLALLYGGEMRINPSYPLWDERDWLICSKGHAAPAMYAALSLKGYFPVEWLATLNRPGTNLPNHCDRNRTPGIDMTTGSFGQGLSLAVGAALGFRQENRDNRVHCIVGDGESREGQVWEACMLAADLRLDNLLLFIDNNSGRATGFCERFRAFGWEAVEVNGHDIAAIHGAIARARRTAGRPSVVVLDTIKGNGCTFATGKSSHHITVSRRQAREAIAALGADAGGA